MNTITLDTLTADELEELATALQVVVTHRKQQDAELATLAEERDGLADQLAQVQGLLGE